MKVMDYTGPLFGKVGRKHIPLRMTSKDVDGLLEALELMVAANGGVAVMPTLEARNQNAALKAARAAIAKAKGVTP